jgi:hypothetical protein
MQRDADAVTLHPDVAGDLVDMADRAAIEMIGGVVRGGRLGRRKLFISGELRDQIGRQASAVRPDQAAGCSLAK